ncbi:MAG: hypothetical protein IJW86_01485 [Clostridia bacterium]|nr:hypothetical protein [Clostridia bacterium]
MAATFSTFTTIFFFLVTLIIVGIIFEKQFIALEDKFDAWLASKTKTNNRKTQPTRTSKQKKTAPSKDSKYSGFAA